MSPGNPPGETRKKRRSPARSARETTAEALKAAEQRAKRDGDGRRRSTSKAAARPRPATAAVDPGEDGGAAAPAAGKRFSFAGRPAAAGGARKSTKIYVLDTNVLLHDPTALRRFEEHDLALPITVLEELDTFKRGADQIHFHARLVARSLDKLSSKGHLTDEEGVPLGSGLGRLRVVVGPRAPESRSMPFFGDSADHRILATACELRDQHRNRDVVFITKDVSLRLKARSLGLIAEDYESDKVPDLDHLYTGRHELNDLEGALIDRFYQEPYLVPLAELGLKAPRPNGYFILRGQGRSALARYSARDDALVRVEKKTAYGIWPRNSEQTFALDALTNPEIQLVTLSGKAGTGKTLLALAGALEVRRHYEQIYLARPIIPLSNRDIGYLPGDIEEKIDPYMQPLWDNLGVIRAHHRQTDPAHAAIQQMLETQKLKISPLAFIRGRSLNRIFFIVDEAQNLTGHEVKTIITRAGEGTKVVFTGDPQQIDQPYLDARSNGLTRLIDKMKGQDLYAHITLERGERSDLSELASNLL